MRNDIIIPAGRGARHKARRLALANPHIRVNVKDKCGVCHYSANALHSGTIWASIYYWQRGNAVHHVVTRRHASAANIAREERIRQIRAMLDDAALACPLCDNHDCLPNWPAIDRCKVEGASDTAAC